VICWLYMNEASAIKVNMSNNFFIFVIIESFNLLRD
jgi:hypothetical protein